MTDTLVTRKDAQAVVRPAGDVVAASVPELRTAMRGAIKEGVQELVVDLANVQMVDSTGLGLLIAAHNSLRKAGGRLSVIHASEEIVDLFKTMRIHQHFSVSGE
ncbi:MAG TPA: STAS domain-containing protein [Bryobacteraceae bacterium]|nr:STAS domain-containing protein [Bryobacteraceae bacterium]